MHDLLIALGQQQITKEKKKQENRNKPYEPYVSKIVGYIVIHDGTVSWTGLFLVRDQNACLIYLNLKRS